MKYVHEQRQCGLCPYFYAIPFVHNVYVAHERGIQVDS